MNAMRLEVKPVPWSFSYEGCTPWGEYVYIAVRGNEVVVYFGKEMKEVYKVKNPRNRRDLTFEEVRSLLGGRYELVLLPEGSELPDEESEPDSD